MLPRALSAVRPRIEPPLILVIGELESRCYPAPVTFSRGLDIRHRLPDHMSKEDRAEMVGINQ